MSMESGSINPAAIQAQVEERRVKETERLDKKREKTAKRIARRAIKQIEAGDMPIDVRGGLFGIVRTKHDAETYARVAECLGGQGVGTTISSVDREEWDLGAPFAVHVVDVINPHTISGKEMNMPDPVEPFRKSRFHRVTQLHPPLSETPAGQ